jgi:hypothetical protein
MLAHRAKVTIVGRDPGRRAAAATPSGRGRCQFTFRWSRLPNLSRFRVMGCWIRRRFSSFVASARTIRVSVPTCMVHRPQLKVRVPSVSDHSACCTSGRACTLPARRVARSWSPKMWNNPQSGTVSKASPRSASCRASRRRNRAVRPPGRAPSPQRRAGQRPRRQRRCRRGRGTPPGADRGPSVTGRGRSLPARPGSWNRDSVVRCRASRKRAGCRGRRGNSLVAPVLQDPGHRAE